MLVQTGVADLGHGPTGVRAQPDHVESRPEAAKFPPDGLGADLGMSQPVDSGLEQAVLLNVLGVVVVGDLDRQREPEPPPDLVCEPDPAPHGVEGLFLPTVTPQQAASDGLAGAMGEGKGDGFQHVVIGSEVDGVVAPPPGVHGVGDQEHDPVHGYLGPDDDRQVAHVHRADP